MATQLPNSVIEALQTGNKIVAIKRLREESGLDLAQAKTAVESWMDEHPQRLQQDTALDTPVPPFSFDNGLDLLLSLCVLSSFVWMLISIVPVIGSLIILFNKDDYHPENLLVMDVYLSSDAETGSMWALDGEVGNTRLRMHAPDLVDDRDPSSGKLRALFPAGTQLPVLYNPAVTSTLFQGRSLHLLPCSKDLETAEFERISWWLRYSVLPFVVALLLSKLLKSRSPRIITNISPGE